ncbi:MAG: glycine zipper domain-containing protein [Ferruginibacter sp.]
MPASKVRKPHHQHHPAPKRARPVQHNRAALAAMILFAVLGFVIGYFASGGNTLSFLAGAIIGAVAGYIIGHMMDKSLEKK